MEPKSQNPNQQPLREIEGPSGLILHPDPPSTVRVSKRAGLVALSVLCGLASVFGYGVYHRQSPTTGGAFSANEPRLVPATAAAKEIVKDIPEGVVNLAAEGQASPGMSTKTGTATATAVPPNAPGKGRPQIQQSQVMPPVPTPEQRRLAEAYGRELQAIAAPTVIQSMGLDNASTMSRSYGAPVSPAGDASPLAALAQLLSPKATNAPDATNRRSTDREFEEQNMQAEKEAFLAQARKAAASGYLPATRNPPISKYEIKAGWEIPSILEQELNSDLPGELKALVTSNVYDTATGRYLLIPRGARLVGTYDSNVAYGQNGLQVLWNRIIYPDGSSVDLGGMVGQDAQGFSGFRGDVDNHYKRLIGFAALSSLFSAGFQLSQTRNGSILQNLSVGETAATAIGQEVSQVGAQITRKNLNIQPTIKIPLGYKFNVRVNRDILFDAPYGP